MPNEEPGGSVLGCQPADPAARQLLEDYCDGRRLPVYSSTVPGTCLQCGMPVLLGPMQQAKLAEDPSMQVWCIFCAGFLVRTRPDIDVLPLGNPEGACPEGLEGASP